MSKLNSLFVGQNRIFLTETDSTNRDALDLLSKSSPSEGTVIYTDRQRAGRGQFGRVWQAEPGSSLLCSFIFRPSFVLVRQQFGLNQAFALALCETAIELGLPQARLKWPNDLYAEGRKLAGMLIENQVRGAYIESCILGIGWNLNQTSFPEELGRAASMKQILGRSLDREAVLSKLCLRLEQRYLQLKSCRLEELQADYQALLLGYGQRRRFRDLHQGLIFEAQVQGVCPQGRLILSPADEPEEKRYFDLQSLEWLWD